MLTALLRNNDISCLSLNQTSCSFS